MDFTAPAVFQRLVAEARAVAGGMKAAYRATMLQVAEAYEPTRRAGCPRVAQAEAPDGVLSLVMLFRYGAVNMTTKLSVDRPR
jgi:hypothetical protein